MTLLSMKDDFARMLNDISAQQSQVALDQVLTTLRDALATQQHRAAQYDQAHFTLATAQSTLASLKEQAQVQLASSAATSPPCRTASAISRCAVAGR